MQCTVLYCTVQCYISFSCYSFAAIGTVVVPFNVAAGDRVRVVLQAGTDGRLVWGVHRLPVEEASTQTEDTSGKIRQY